MALLHTSQCVATPFYLCVTMHLHQSLHHVMLVLPTKFFIVLDHPKVGRWSKAHSTRWCLLCF